MPWLRSCLSPQSSRQKKPTISPPLHLLLKPDGESQNHVFRAKVFKKPRPCHLCHQPIHQLGSCCRVCKYVCHKACESKYIKETQKPGAKAGKTATLSSAIASPTVNNNNISTLPNNNNNHSSSSSNSNSAAKAGVGSALSRRRARALSKDGMDLRYVTERIIALWVPGDVSRAAYLQGQQQAANMLRTKHGDNYMVFNLSAPRRSLRHHHHSVRELGWPRDLAPPLERLCGICKDMDSWLKGNSRRIAVVHARGSKDRIGVVVAAYMHYSHICGGDDQALDRFAMKRFLQDQVEDVDQPSHRRYVDYFSGLLSGSIKINSAPLYLTHVTVLGAPAFEPSHPDGPDPGGGPGRSVAGGCRAFLKVYEGLVPVHTSAVCCVNEDARAFTINVAAERGRRGLQLRGDVLVKCYHRHYSKKVDPNDPHNREAREIVFACQFHTCAVSDYTLSFTRSELDYACDDLRFPLDGAVELHFSPTPEPRLPSPAPTPAVPTLDSSDDPVTRWDSYEHLASGLGHLSDDDDDDVLSEHDDEMSHTYGPLDGSLYATVGRKQQQQQQQLQQQQLLHPDGHHLRQRQMLLQQQQDQHLQVQHQRARPLAVAAVAATGPSPSSEHTISMDSGISSAGNGGGGGGGSVHTAPAPTPAPGPASSSSQRALDDLLNDMLLTVESIPDLKPDNQLPQRARAVSVDLQRPQRSGGGGDARQQRGGSAPQPAQPAPTAGGAGVGGGPPRPMRQSSLSQSPGPSVGPHSASPCCSAPAGARAASSSSPLAATTDTELDEIPYHARLDGRPFTYVPGAPNTPQQQPAMAPSVTPAASNGLSSPGLVRKATSQAAPVNGYATSTPRHGHANGTAVGSPAWSTTPRESTRYQHQDDSLLSDGAGSRSHLTWLQRQQQKLRERREGLLRSARQPHEARLLSELRSLHHSHSASRRLDGYTSDTTMFADEDEEDLCRPLHINTSGKLNGGGGGLSAPGSPLQRRAAPYTHAAQPYPLSRQKSDSSFDRERPFVAVKRQNKYHESPQREDSYSSWRSDEDRFSRPQTPAFPVQPRTPYSNNGHQFDSAGLPPKSPTTQRKDRSPSPMSDMQSQGIYMQHSPKSPVSANGQSSPTVYSMHSRRSSTHSGSEPPQEVAAHHVKFVRDTSRYWYKPNISREEAIALLRDAAPGTFVVRDSNSFPGAFGLALKVAVPPATVAQKAAFFSGDASELVRHFLVEPTSRGVKLKGCTNEPVFSSLSALVYQHSIMAMALPCKLVLPDGEIGLGHLGGGGGTLQSRHVTDLGSSPGSSGSLTSAQQLLAQGAACNVLYLYTTDTESLTGPQAIRRAMQQLFTSRPLPTATVVHFKVSSQGITLTDNKRRLFFRRHYPVSTISHCGLDPDDHRWSQKSPDTGMPISSNRCFGFVARKPASRSDNQCHIFAELEPEQPANAIVNFVSKVMMSGVGSKNVV